MPHVLLVDDDPETLDWLSEFVKSEGFTVATADSLRAARIQLTRLTPDILLTELLMPDGQGIELVEDLESRGSTEFVVMTGHASVESVIGALRAGATDYLVKPADIERLKAILQRVPRPEELREQIGELRQELRKLGRFGHILGGSPPIQKLYDQLGRVSPTSATVMKNSHRASPGWQRPSPLVSRIATELGDRMTPDVSTSVTGTITGHGPCASVLPLTAIS